MTVRIFLISSGLLLVLMYLSHPRKVDLSGVDGELRPYVDQFLCAAGERGWQLDLSELRMEFTDGYVTVDSQSFCGYAWNFRKEGPPFVQIARVCWDEYSVEEKEILVFHELGHALLQRPHTNKRLPSGSFASLMNSLHTVGVYDDFTMQKRSYYLDELFSATPPSLPDWARDREQVTVIMADTLELAGSGWEFRNEGEPIAGGEISQEAAASGNYALKIYVSPEEEAAASSYWRYIIRKPQVPEGTKLVLKAKIRTEEVTGPGVVMAMRGDNFRAGRSPLNITSENQLRITGTSDFTEYVIDWLDYFPEGVDALYIFLLLKEGSTGTVYFDDITLEQHF